VTNAARRSSSIPTQVTRKKTFDLPEDVRSRMEAILASQIAAGVEADVLAYLSQWLLHLGFLNESQVFFAAGEIGSFVTEWYTTYCTQKDKLKSVFITVSDTRYLVCAHPDCLWILDLLNLKKVCTTPEPFLTSITLNINELFRRVTSSC
jgi:hypothetical protein